jgi:hypothetical protein
MCEDDFFLFKTIFKNVKNQNENKNKNTSRGGGGGETERRMHVRE